MGKLENKVVVVTGGNSGIGFAAAKRFAEEGATVVVTGRRADAVDDAAKQIGGIGIVGDAAKLEDIDAMVHELKERFGTIDHVFLNAGVAPMGPFETFSESDFDRVFGINVKGVFFGVQKLLPIMKPHGSITVNASVVSGKGMPGAEAYSATKAAVRSLVRSFAAGLSQKGLRINAISPGPIETPLWAKTGLPESAVSEFGENVGGAVPLGRFGKAEEIAAAAAFLASDDASYVNGADFQVDGGFAQI